MAFFLILVVELDWFYASQVWVSGMGEAILANRKGNLPAPILRSYMVLVLFEKFV